MYFITRRATPRYHQMTVEDLLTKSDDELAKFWNFGETDTSTSNTVTVTVDKIPDVILYSVNVDSLIAQLREYNSKYGYLADKIKQYEAIPKDRRTNVSNMIYSEFPIPKKDGGLRIIDAPDEELKSALAVQALIYKKYFGAMYHTSAFAYIKGRDVVSCMKRHQKNDSHWFAKFDLHGFFPSTTMEFVLKMLEMVFPFSEVLKRDDGREELSKALSLGFLDGGLPQGTPLSPFITNVMMIPVDHILSNTLRNFNGKRYVYTRYADDFTISSRVDFRYKDVENLIVSTLRSFDAPFYLNTKKTRYGSRAGANWNFGIMLNKDNEMTIGYRNKRRLKAMLTSYALDRVNGKKWDLGELQSLNGVMSHYNNVEPGCCNIIISHLDQKFGVNIKKFISDDLRGEPEKSPEKQIER